jgi:hypothetical protein
MPVLFRLSVLIVLSFLILSCEMNLEELMTLPPKDSEIRNIENLTPAEFNIAKRICTVFEEKETDFRNHLNKGFTFKLTSLKCGREEYRDRRVSLILSEDEFDGELSFRSDGYHGRYLKDIETSTRGMLVRFCLDVLSGDPPLNTVDINGGTEKLQIKFINENNRDIFQAHYYQLNLDGNYTSRFIDELWVNTGSTNGNLLRGIVYHRAQQIPCSSDSTPGSSQEFHQVLEY